MKTLGVSLLTRTKKLSRWLETLSPWRKLGLVLGGYGVAVAVGLVAVQAGETGFHLWGKGGGRAPGASAMTAFAIFILSLGGFGLGALLPSMLGLYFLRPYPAFWRWCSGVAMAVAGVGMLGTMLRLKVSRMVSGEELLLVVVGTACLAVVFGVCACFTPSGSRGPRWALVVAAGLEIGTFASWIAFAATTPQVTVVNQAGTELTNIVASGRGFHVSVGALAAGKQRRVGVQASGESGLQLEFDANGQHYVTSPNAYLERHAYYHYEVIVAPDFTVSVTPLD